MGSLECPKVLPCLAKGTEVRGNWDQVIFGLGWFFWVFFCCSCFIWGFLAFFCFAFCFVFCCFVLWGFSLVLFWFFFFCFVLVLNFFFFIIQGCGEGKPNKKPLTFLQPAHP